MSYHDMTARDVERDDALQGDYKPMELMVWSQTWGKPLDYEQIQVTMHGFYNDMTNAYRFQNFSFDRVTWKHDVEKNHNVFIVDHCESLAEALRSLTKDNNYQDVVKNVSSQIAIWTEIKNFIQQWKP